MKLTIIGASRGTGRQLVDQGLALGYEMTAVVRNATAIALQNERLEVFQGDVLQADLTVCK